MALALRRARRSGGTTRSTTDREDTAVTVTTTAPQTASIGTDPDGNPVLWHLADAQGRPAHGLITASCGAGASVLLTHITAAATRAGITTWFLHNGTQATSPASWTTSNISEFMGALEETVRTRLDERDDAEPLLVAIDHPGVLASHGATLQTMATVAATAKVGFIVRAFTLLRMPAQLREITAQSQYVALDHGPALEEEALLPGCTAPAEGARPGQGRYGRDGACRPVAVHRP